MISSFYAGVSGLHVNQLWLDIVGENLANVNTTGFKKSRPIFEDILNQNYKPAQESQDGIGGINPMQIGNGATMASVEVLHKQGTDIITDKNTDVAIIGEGSFFVVNDGISPYDLYTRAGTFNFDPSGNLANQSGLKVQGWNALRDDITDYLIKNDSNKTLLDTDLPLEGVKIVRNDILPGEATTKLTLSSGLNSQQSIAIDPVSLGFTKNIESVVPVGAGLKTLNTAAAWADAGFNKTPNGMISINGAEFKIGGDGGYGSPLVLMNAINQSAQAGVTINYVGGKFIISPDNPGVDIALTETPITPGQGFFTQSMIKAGTKETPYIYNTSFNTQIQFEHLLDPNNPDKNYYRWRAVDPLTTELLTTNAYHYERGDVMQGQGAIDPGSVTKEELKLESINVIDEYTEELATTIWYANISNPDIDPTTMRVYIKDPITNSTILATQGKWKNPDPMGAVTTVYYFDDNGGDARFGKSKNGLDRIVFSTALLTATLSAPQAVITVDYNRNGFNMHNSTVDPASLKIKQNGAETPASLWRFNDNQGIGGSDQITFYSAASKDEVVINNINTSAGFAKAGFNWNAPIGTSEVWSTSALSSQVHFKWNGGSWTSGSLSSYDSVGQFMSSVKQGTGSKVTLEYDPRTDRFTLSNAVAISAYQTTATGFFSLAKLKGEGSQCSADGTTFLDYSWVSFDAGENPVSRDEVVANQLDTRQTFARAGFNNGGPAGNSLITFSWLAINPDTNLLDSFVWTSLTMSTFTTVDSFINDVNDAVEEGSGTYRPLPVILRYDPILDRFTMVNTNLPDYFVRVQQDNVNGFLTNAKLLTDTLGAKEIPHSIISSNDVVTADYYANKGTNAKGILELDADKKVINNFVDTEAAPVVMSTAKIMGSADGINMAGGWGQFSKGVVDGTISITTKLGTYTSRQINSANYATVFDLFQEINTSNAKVHITYHSDTDRISIATVGDGDEIILEETGLMPLFSTFKITTGKVVGGNNNVVMDLGTERPAPSDGWQETTGLYGTGNDYFRVNIAPNEIKNDKIGEGGKGMRGTQILDEIHRNAQTTINILNADVDEDTITVYDINAGVIPKGKPIEPDGVYWKFSDNTGPGSRDQIKLIDSEVGDFYVSYTRLNAFDLAHPDVDRTTLAVKIDGRILAKDEYTFLDGSGTNGLDKILIQSQTNEKSPGNIGAGDITVDYRLTTPQAVDFFISNGNNGPEAISFTPNSSLTQYERGGNAYKADSGDKAEAILKEKGNREYTISTDLFDAYGVSYKTDMIFEKLSENKWLWTVMNPVEKEKVAGYGLLMFKGDGTFDSENSQVFGSPSDPGLIGGKFKGIYFDAPIMATPPESGGAPPSERGVNTTMINVDFDLLQHTLNDIKITDKDGAKMGKLDESKTMIDNNGQIIASYDNGQTLTIGQIALAQFANPSGMAKYDGTLFGETVNSGSAQIGKPGSGGRGMLKTGHLEGSNVDLIKEFADMIIAQRAFQANGKTVTTADQIFQDIIGIKR